MSLSIYQAAVPPLLRGLQNLSHILKKGAEDAEARKIDPSVYINARLAPDMLPLVRQVQIACDGAVRGAVRLSAGEVPSIPDTETTFDELQARIAKAIALVSEIPAEKYEGAEDRTIVLTFPQREFTFQGTDFLQYFVLPNFYFHISAAYMILRENGVQLGKPDYLGAS